MTDQPSASAAGTVAIGDLVVRRMGFGAMRLTGPGIWGAPADRPEAVRVLRRAVELGVTLIDTADSYGPFVSEELIAEALWPYPDELIIATKAGYLRPGPGEWQEHGEPEHLRKRCESSLRRLKLDCIDLFQLHRIDPDVPLEAQLGVLNELQEEGKIRHIGLSAVTVDQLRRAQQLSEVVSVQNRYNLLDRRADAVLAVCEAEEMAFLSWAPLGGGADGIAPSIPSRITDETGASPAQVALAWLLQRSPAMLPIPGTSSVEHLEENVAAGDVCLEPDVVQCLTSKVEYRRASGTSSTARRVIRKMKEVAGAILDNLGGRV